MCKRFFEKQRVDEVGFYSVKLQKVLLYLAVFNLLGLLAGLTNWLSALVEVLLLWVAFSGAYKRRHGPLRAYVCINISFMILGIILGVATLMFYGSHVDTVPSQDLNIPMENLRPVQNGSDVQEPMDIKPLSNETVPTNTSIIDIHPLPTENISGAYIAVWFLLAVSEILVFILKIVSIIMAARLARMIIAYNSLHLAHPLSEFPTRTEVSPTPTTPYMPMQPFPQTPTMYPQPMYVPVVINGQPNGQPQQFLYPNPYFVPQAMYTPMAPPQSNDKN